MKNRTDTSGRFFGEDGRSVSTVASDVTIETLNEELASIDDGDLEAWIVDTRQHMDALHARWLFGIAEYERRDLGSLRHGLTTIGWMRSVMRMTGRIASSTLRRARGLHKMPNVGRLAVVGDITPDAVAQLDKARRRHPDAFPTHEAVLADAATYLDPSDLRKAIDHWEQQVDYPSTIARTRAQRKRRRLSINQTFDGMWAIAGELDPESGSIVNEAIEAASRSAYLDPDDWRTPWQVRADALADICEQSLRHNTARTSSPTNLDNLILLCRTHHTATHERHARDAEPAPPHVWRR
ncbi:MAG: DUF222 domain-containing protein [Acidimicrobiia bacterium]|nr:DUF222 domain-containing protein [Acidimicrobiia bacterium]